MTLPEGQNLDSIHSDQSINEPFVEEGRATARMVFDFGLMLSLFSENARDGKVLDFGCGSAWLSEFLVRQGFDTVSFDIHNDLERIVSTRKLVDLRLKSNLWTFVEGDGHEMPFTSNTFSQICCYDSLHHMHDYDKVFSEFFRVTKSGARIIFVEPGARHSKSPETIAFLESLGTDHPGWIERDIVLEEIDLIARKAGFESGIQIVPSMHPLSFQSFSSTEWKTFREGDSALRDQMSEYLSNVNYWERTVFYVER